MQQRIFFTFAWLLLLLVFSSSSFAQNYTRIGLPEGALARLGKGYVNDVKYSPDGTRLAVATSIGVWLYDTSTDTELNFFSEVPDYVEAIAFSPDGSTLASSGYSPNYIVRLWDTETGELRATLDGYEEILALAFSPDGTVLASSGGGPDYPIRLWNVVNRQLQDTLLGHTKWTSALSFSVDGKTLVSGSEDNTVRLWDGQTGKLKGLLEAHRDDVNAVVFSPDGKTLASGSSDGTIQLWDMHRGRIFAILKGPAKFPEAVNAIAFSPDGKTLASATVDQIWLWDTVTKQLKEILEGHAERVTNVVFSPDGKTIVSASWDWTLRLWDAPTGKLRKTFGEHSISVNTVAFSPDGETVASASRGLIHLWDMKGDLLQLWYARTGEHVEHYVDHIDYVQTVVFSPDGKLIASGGYDSRLRLWNAKTGHHIVTLRGGGPAVAFSPDGTLLANAYRQVGISGTIGLWDVQSSEIRDVLEAYHGLLTCLVFSPDGKTLVSGSQDSEIIFWDIPNAQHRQSITTQHIGPVSSVAFSPDGKTLASGSYDQTLRLWDPHTGKRKAVLQYPDDVTAVTFAPNGRTLAVGWGGWQNNRIQLLDTETLQPLETFVGHTEDITDLAFSSDSGILASTSCDGTILLWRTGADSGPADVNSDGSINIDDLRFIAARLGHVGEGEAADVNDDGVVNILDLVAVTAKMERAVKADAAH